MAILCCGYLQNVCVHDLKDLLMVPQGSPCTHDHKFDVLEIQFHFECK